MKRHMGRQVLGELSFCEHDTLNNKQRLEELLRKAAEASGATLISVHTHHFQPHGVSGVAILAESHLSVHTWPELGYAAVDAFTCGDHVNPAQAVAVLEQGFGAQFTTTVEMIRGMATELPGSVISPESHEQAPPV